MVNADTTTCRWCERSVDAHEAGCRKLKPKVYAFINGPDGIGGVMVVALAEDGESLAGHASSSEGWAMRDIDSQRKHEAYAKKYPDGYDFIWLQGEVADDLTIIQDLVAKNKALAEAANSVQG